MGNLPIKHNAYNKYFAVTLITIFLASLGIYLNLSGNLTTYSNATKYVSFPVENVTFDDGLRMEYVLSYDFDGDGLNDSLFKLGNNLVAFKVDNDNISILLNISFSDLVGSSEALLGGATIVNDGSSTPKLLIYGLLTNSPAPCSKIILYDYIGYNIMWDKTFEIVNVTPKFDVEYLNLKSIDLNGDHVDEIIYSYYNVYLLNSSNGDIKWIWRGANYDTPWRLYIGRFDNDNVKDILLYSPYKNLLLSISGINGYTIWELEASKYGELVTSIHLDDINQDNISDVILTAYKNGLHALTYSDGNIIELWSVNEFKDGYIYGSYTINNSTCLLVNYVKRIAMVNQSDGSIVWVKEKFTSGLIVDDLDSDGELEVIGGGNLTCYQIDIVTGEIETEYTLDISEALSMNPNTSESIIYAYYWTSIQTLDLDNDDYNEVIALIDIVNLFPKYSLSNQGDNVNPEGSYMLIIDLNDKSAEGKKLLYGGDSPKIINLYTRNNNHLILIFTETYLEKYGTLGYALMLYKILAYF